MDSKTISDEVCRREGHHITYYVTGDKELILCIKCGLKLDEIRAGIIEPIPLKSATA